MNRFFALLFCLAIFFQSCDDGDIIVKTFNFDNADLKTCGGVGNYVFYKVNPDAQESLSLKLGFADSLYREVGAVNFELDGTNNVVNYRTYDGPLGSNYFCSSIPPTSPNVNVDYVAASGTAVFTTTFFIEDDDGVPQEFELAEDTDGDGLDNIYDFDDDGDNVPTALELDPEHIGEDPTANPLNTDGDDKPDYLDTDDDNDTVITRYEDDGDLNPRNNVTNPDVGPDYLNVSVANTYIENRSLKHTYKIYKTVQITLKNLVLVRGDEEIVIETLNLGIIENVEVLPKSFTPPPL